MEFSQQEKDQLQKEANDIMKELLKTPQDQEREEESHYQPVKTTTQVRQLFIGNVKHVEYFVFWNEYTHTKCKIRNILKASFPCEVARYQRLV